MALKDQILSSDDRKVEPVEVPEWGVTVLLRTISGADRSRFEDSLTEVTKDGQIKFNGLDQHARLLVKCIVDDDGKRIFADDDAFALSQKSASVLERLAKKAAELNAIGAAADQAVEDAGKDSAPDQNAGSTSASPKK